MKAVQQMQALSTLRRKNVGALAIGGLVMVIAISGMDTSASQMGLAATIKGCKVPIFGTYTPTKARSEPVSPMVYNGFCGYREMAQTGIGYYAEKLRARES